MNPVTTTSIGNC